MLEKFIVPQDVKDALSDLIQDYQQILGDNLYTIVVHGSIAMDCFKPDSSDIDVLVIVYEPLALIEKQQLGKAHLELQTNYGHSVELSVLLAKYLEEFEHPTPYEFHYSDDHIASFTDGSVDLITPRKDADLAAHFTITKHYGVTLFGEDVQEIFPDVPKVDYLDSIARDAEWCYDNIMQGADKGKCAVPKYAVLNFCRVLAYIDADLITSKQTGAEWALKNLPKQYHDAIRQALNEYEELGSSQPIPCADLKSFAQYAYGVIQETR